LSQDISGGAGVRRSAATILFGALLSGPAAMIVVSLVAPQPEWTTVESFASSYHAIQTLPYILGYMLLAGFVWFTAACHSLAQPSLRSRSSAALVFTGVYATLVFTNYTIQIGFIPRMLDQRASFIAALTMSNPASFAWFLEMFGYAAMGVATWLVAPMFGGTRRGDAIRWLLVGNGVLSIVGAVCTALFDRWVFSPTGFASFAGWNLLVVICYLLIAVSPDAGLAPVSDRG
jgi:hypothetical protein